MSNKKFRIAVSGTSTDWGVEKRVIDAQVLIEMANNYDPSLYVAQLWNEHIKGYSRESEFIAFGEVVSLSTEDFDVRGELRTALYAEVKPYQIFIDAIKNGFNKFFSIEIDKSFSDFESSYLTGLGLVSEPGSIGTEMAFFSKEKNNELSIFIGESYKVQKVETSIFERISTMFNKDKQIEVEAALEVLATQFQKSSNDQASKILELEKNLKDKDQLMVTLSEKIDSFQKILDNLPAQQERDLHTGDDKANDYLTDC